MKQKTIILLSILVILIAFSLIAISITIYSNNKNSTLDKTKIQAAQINFSQIEGIPKNFPQEKTVNLVFSTDKKYKDYLKVAIKSAITNKNKDSYYNIYILCIDLPKKETDKFNSFKQKDVNINLIPLKVSMLKGKIKHHPFLHHVTKADYFKFYFPQIFSPLDKILYIDCDTLILKDLSELYNTNIEDKYIGIVRRIANSIDTKEIRYNIGITLFNLKNWRKDELDYKLINAKNEYKNDTTVTQATFNKVIPKNQVQFLSLIYNYPNKTSKQDFIEHEFKKHYYPYLNQINDIQELEKQVAIVHYAGYSKPWYNPKINFAKQWWEYAHMINPEWKVEKREFVEHTINTILYTYNKKNTKNPIDYIKVFYSIYTKN